MSITDSAPLAPPGGGFDSGAAAFHAVAHARREGWRPLITLGIVYFAAGAAALVLLGFAMWPFLDLTFDLAIQEQNNPGAAPDSVPPGFWPAFALMMAGYIAYLIFYLVFYAVIDAALLRWLLGRGARLRLGGAELRLTLLNLLWALVLPVVMFAPFWALLIAAFAAGTASAAAGWVVGALCFFALLGGFAVWIWLSSRLAPAAALTVRDGRLRVFGGWAATRGVFWPLLGAFFIVWAIYIGVAVGMQMLIQPFMILAGGEMFTLGASLDPDFQPDVEQLLGALLSPGMLVLYAVSGLFSLVVYFAFQALLAGVNAYLLKRPGV